LRILARFMDGKDFKQKYMDIVDGYEKEEEIVRNRLALRRYLRELVVNQKRVLEAAKRQDLSSELEAIKKEREQIYREIEAEAE